MLTKIFAELKCLRRDVNEIKKALLPVAKMTPNESREFRRINQEMRLGKKIPIECVLE